MLLPRTSVPTRVISHLLARIEIEQRDCTTFLRPFPPIEDDAFCCDAQLLIRPETRLTYHFPPRRAFWPAINTMTLGFSLDTILFMLPRRADDDIFFSRFQRKPPRFAFSRFDA